jgi:hypothetical protein
MTRLLRSTIDGLTHIQDSFDGSDSPDVEYRFDAEFGCEIEECVTDEHSRVVRSTLKLSRSLSRDDRHCVRYSVAAVAKRDAPTARLKPWVTSVYPRSEKVLREIVLVKFPARRCPEKFWALTETTGNAMPGMPQSDTELRPDGLGCVQYEFSNLSPMAYYSICWDWNDIRAFR